MHYLPKTMSRLIVIYVDHAGNCIIYNFALFKLPG